uniref:TOG domain-containing protein n=2 Tax=Odontella aurita TaxID=265563 RepID=A0A7S4K262_9STRA|mmetsp:Transcript_5989/g.17399  ORF Transcript_5989/g.17399 Transcript_5989/m.17399 type:complete len:2586 (+) Transcript_5989:1667-9424(+)
MFRADKKVEAGLAAMVDASAKKHAAADAVAQVDGLIAVHILLIRSASAKSAPALPASAVKALDAGSSAALSGKKASFLYGSAMIDAAATDAVVGRLLHRVIAAYVKYQSKRADEGGASSASEGIVRSAKSKKDGASSYSAAARTLARCACNPYPHRRQGGGAGGGGRKSSSSSAPSPSSAVATSVQTVLTYSPLSADARGALLSALFSSVNTLSGHDASVTASLGSSREAREAYHPVDETYAKLPVVRGRCAVTSSHRNYDPNSARRIAAVLAGHGPGGRMSGRDLAKAMVLSHAGTTQKSTGSRQREALMTYTIGMIREVVAPLAKENNSIIAEIAELMASCASSSSLEKKKDDKIDGEEGAKEEEKMLEDAKPKGKAKAASVAGRKGKPQDAKKPSSSSSSSSKKAAEGGGSDDEGDSLISAVLHESALSLLTTLGGIAGNFDPQFDDPEDEDNEPYVLARKLCVDEVCPRLREQLDGSAVRVAKLTEEEVDLYRSPEGILFKPAGGDSEAGEAATASAAGGASDKGKNAEKKRGKGRKAKGDFGAGFEEEEWERQMKKELAAKKKKAAPPAAAKVARALAPEEKKLLAAQTRDRRQIRSILEGEYARCLAAVGALVGSEIEVGNACLPGLASAVTRAACLAERGCPATDRLPKLRDAANDALTSLAGCVYEIDEAHASTLARALVIAHRPMAGKAKAGAGPGAAKTDAAAPLTVSPLPSPCAPAACAVFEMDDVGEALSGPSFVLLFPVLRSALSGPRTAPGTEGALRVLHRHCPLLSGDDADPSIRPLRRDMASAVLELLAHDRSQTFNDPTPVEALVDCYSYEEGTKPSAGDLAPLLDERGALGGKNCRSASMEALGSVAGRNPRLIKTNPLVENRIWLNCFEKDAHVKDAARRAWRVAHGVSASDDGDALPPPSKMYAMTLLPLLNHSDESVAAAASDAFARGMGMHPDTASKNAVRLCGNFIEAYPTASDDGGNGAAAAAVAPSASAKPVKPIAAPAPKKKPTKKISTGLPKKTTKKSVLGGGNISAIGTGVGKPKKKTTSKATQKKIAALAPKQKERTHVDLESQFLQAPGASSKKKDEIKDDESKVSTRRGVLGTVSSLSDPIAGVTLDLDVLKMLTTFLVSYGLADGNEGVRTKARDSLRDAVATHGAGDEAIAFLLPHFEAVLGTGQADETGLGSLSKERVPRDVQASDRRKEGVVVALGSAALHLKGDENLDKIDGTIDMLLAAFKTPSEDVQSSVALCLSKLMKKGHTQARLADILNDLMKDCLHGDMLASRRGAAYGISAAVKGSGIASLKKYEVVKRLEEACASGSTESKEGALFAIELLSGRLGLLFEPYVIVLLPSLLKSFSDPSDHVRNAASHAAGLIMSKLSAHGVKLVMPAVLTSFDDPSWRTKQASIHILGAMSHCAPKQLASCLPKVVPKLTEAFSDTHPKVRGSAEEALGEIIKVIRNPEISSISPVLLQALIDPAQGTLKALETLIETEFLHAIDAPSLALIVPVIHRGLRDRAATTKRYGALIAGNICTMINDPRDFVPYLPILLPDLKVVLLDPIPDVRSTSAKALGSLTRSLGEATFPELRPWLLDTLKIEKGTSVERSGAAQGLTEVLIAGGTRTVEAVLTDEILPLRSHPQAATREGVLWVLTFLPSSMGQGFAPFIDASLPALLSGLADESEPVRDVALRAGRVMVRSHGKSHIDKILPPLEKGLSDDDHRIRVSSLTLLGDLLSMLGGTKVVKGEADTQDDIRQAERAQAQIALVLGSETRKRLLSELYLARSDTAAVVRQIAVQVWKTFVSVTPRTLREILGVLVGQIIDALASGHPERTQVAGRCLGDVVGKLGDAVLPEIIPVLRASLSRGDEHPRRGVCVGLNEVISCSSKQHIDKYLDILVKAVQDALCDEDEGVRELGASCFQSLYSTVGNRAMDEVVPVLLIAMESGGDDEHAKARALNGLTGILSIRSRELLPYLIPRLLQRPITESHADALGSIAGVTGGTIHMHFSSIIPTLIFELASFYGENLDDDEKRREEGIRSCARQICGNVDDTGVNWLISEIVSKCSSDKDGVRKESCWMIQVVVEERKAQADFYEQIPIMYRELLYRLNDESKDVLKAASAALGAMSKNVPAEELVNHIEFIRNLIASMVSDARRRKGGVGDGEFLLPGFNMPKGLEPLLPVYQRGILYGSASIREVSASGLGELMNITASKYLAGPFIIKMTGPLLRIVGDRNPSEVKIAIITTLGLILTKGGPALRAFVPQFQTTFVKALSDPSRQVRIEAIKALALLMPLSTRLDPLIKELVASSLGKGPSSAAEMAGAVAVQTATLEALSVVLRNGGKKAKLPESIPSALEASKVLLTHEDEGVREGAAKVMGASCGLLGEDVASDVVNEVILAGSSKDAGEKKHGRVCGCHRIMASPVGSELGDDLHGQMMKLAKALTKDENATVRGAACVAVGAAIGSAEDSSACLANVESSLLKCMDPKELMEVHQALALGLCTAVHMKSGVFDGKEGLAIMKAALKLAMSGTQRVQFAFNDFLWLALRVEEGDGGLEEFANIANFEDSKAMKSVYSKVLVRIKKVDLDD